jgi:hypothetical protein
MNDLKIEEKIETPVAPTQQLPAVPEGDVAPPFRREHKTPRKRPEGSIVNIATAIAAITADIGIVPKLGVNAFHRYRYAQMQDVLQKLTPLMAKHGLIVVQTEVGRTMFDDDRAVAVEYEFTIAHSSGEMWPDRPKQTGLCRCRDSKGGFDDKAINKCHTAARKYFLLALFQIATGDEDDADAGHTEGPPARPSARGYDFATPSPPATTGARVASPVSATTAQGPETGGARITSAQIEAADKLLTAAANKGEATLRTAWETLGLKENRGQYHQALKEAMTRRHKPRALEVDAAKQQPPQDEQPEDDFHSDDADMQ